MVAFSKGRYVARMAQGAADVAAAQRLRARGFPGAPDADIFDDICRHVLVEDSKTGRLVCCYRFLPLTCGREIGRSYSAQFYDLSALGAFDGPMVEMGRFCLDPETRDPDAVRVAWGAMTRHVDGNGIEMLFGCSSFEGTRPQAYLDTFAMLRERHLAPRRWLPRVKAGSVYRFAQTLASAKPDMMEATRRMPPLLKTYLLMGGWVSDHAVVDRQLNTMHVFTGVEIQAIPEARKRLLRAQAG